MRLTSPRRFVPRRSDIPGHLRPNCEPSFFTSRRFCMGANSCAQYLTQIFQERQPLETVAVSVLAKVVESVGLACFLTWWGTRTNPFE